LRIHRGGTHIAKGSHKNEYRLLKSLLLRTQDSVKREGNKTGAIRHHPCSKELLR